MKILFVGAYVPYPLTSGGRIRSYYLLRELAAQHEVHLLAFSHERVSESCVTALSEICRSMRTIPAPVRLDGPVHRIRRFLQNPEDILIGRSSPDMVRELHAALERESFDLIILDDMGAEEYVRDLAGQPVLLSKHNCEWRLLRQQARYKVNRPWAWGLNRLEALATCRYESWIASSVHRVIVVSEPDKTALLECAPDARIDVVPNGVSVADYDPTKPSSGRGLLFVGALFWYPNVDAVFWFCRAVWPHIRRVAPDACFDLVGSGLSVALQALDGQPGIQVIPNAPDVRPHLARSAVFVAPLRIGSGTRLKILEALAAGRAVVATSVGAEGLDLWPEREFLLADNPVDFAGACVQLLDDRAMRERLARAGRQAAEIRYDWPIVLAGLNRICVEVSEGTAKR